MRGREEEDATMLSSGVGLLGAWRERTQLVSGYARASVDAGPASWATRVKGQARLVRKA